MRTFLAFVAAALLLMFASPGGAAPRAGGPQECMVLADLAIVARAAAEERVDRATLDRMTAKIYAFDTPRAQAMAAAVSDRAYIDTRSPQAFAVALGEHCMNHGGDLDGFLGRAS